MTEHGEKKKFKRSQVNERNYSIAQSSTFIIIQIFTFEKPEKRTLYIKKNINNEVDQFIIKR